jgi:uncharacterized membrane protein YkoI
MSKTIIFLFALILTASFVLAEQQLTGAGIEGLGQSLEGQVQAGNYISNEGEVMQIRSEDGIKIKVEDIEAHSLLNITPEKIQNKTQLKVQLSNGRNTEIKIMPNTASETALTRLRMKVCNESNNCTIQLKEVGSGDNNKVEYEVQIERHSKIIGIFEKKMQVSVEVDAETGAVLGEHKPWWAFIATEPAE